MSRAHVVRTRAALGACAGLLAAIALYPALRFVSALSGHEPNPALLTSPGGHVPLFWRAWTCGFVGAMVAVMVAAFVRDHDRAAQALLRALPWAAALLVLQVLLLP